MCCREIFGDDFHVSLKQFYDYGIVLSTPTTRLTSAVKKEARECWGMISFHLFIITSSALPRNLQFSLLYPLFVKLSLPVLNHAKSLILTDDTKLFLQKIPPSECVLEGLFCYLRCRKSPFFPIIFWFFLYSWEK